MNADKVLFIYLVHLLSKRNAVDRNKQAETKPKVTWVSRQLLRQLYRLQVEHFVIDSFKKTAFPSISVL